MSQNTQLRVGRQRGDGDGRVLYDDGSVTVRERSMIVDGVRFDIQRMEHIHTVRGPRSPLWVNTGIAVGVVALVIVMTARYLDFRGWVGAGVVLAVPLFLWMVAGVNSPRASELWCEYEGHTVQVVWVRGREAYRYGQICRALMRALENLP